MVLPYLTPFKNGRKVGVHITPHGSSKTILQIYFAETRMQKQLFINLLIREGEEGEHDKGIEMLCESLKDGFPELLGAHRNDRHDGQGSKGSSKN